MYNFVILFFLCLISDLRRRRQLASHAHSQRRVASITPSVFDRWSRQHQTTESVFLVMFIWMFYRFLAIVKITQNEFHPM